MYVKISARFILNLNNYFIHCTMKFDERILAILVLYHTKLSDSKTFISLTNSLAQNEIVLDLYVYDNSPDYNENNLFNYLNWNIIYKPDATNSGVSKAYNTGAGLAIKKKKKFVLLLDQDTDFPVNAIPQYLDAINDYPDDRIFAPLMISENKKIISPGLFKFGRAFTGKDNKPGIYNFNGRSLINCGLCIEIDSFWKVNGYNEKIELDFSDHDFIKRYKETSAARFIMIDLVVEHQLSVNTKNSLQNDKTRFEYYLQGITFMSSNVLESFLYKFHGFLRASKLSLQHKSSVFIALMLKNILK
ncbi:MAG: glycosyl transferase, group 2 family protein [Mucilaginibacter sp.]|nr:glycosyl transferase, group 2 family protein [Mucilaginibacter sp.]